MSDTTQRRNSPRHRFSCRARFRNPLAGLADPERPCITHDFSREGVYFIADDLGLREHMKLLLRFPENLPSVQDRDYLVEIMRINALPEDRCGIGARLILRTMISQMECMGVPKVDLSRYGCLHAYSRLLDLYA